VADPRVAPVSKQAKQFCVLSAASVTCQRYVFNL